MLIDGRMLAKEVLKERARQALIPVAAVALAAFTWHFLGTHW